jgi:hypothetical protein
MRDLQSSYNPKEITFSESFLCLLYFLLKTIAQLNTSYFTVLCYSNNQMIRITFFINVIDNSYIDIEIYDEDIMEFKTMVFYFGFLVIQALFL